jgi:hypothetical protein
VLEIPQSCFGVRPEYAIDIPGVEPKAAEALLKVGNVVAPGHRGTKIKHAITKSMISLDQCRPRLAGADPVLHEPA